MISLQGANPAAPEATARIAIDSGRPVVVRAVDAQPLSALQVSSKLREYIYVLDAGNHVLWLSSAPYGMPLLPQRLHCYVLTARLTAGVAYVLYFDAGRQVPVLGARTGSEPDTLGVLVDAPLVFDRACAWR